MEHGTPSISYFFLLMKKIKRKLSRNAYIHIHYIIEQLTQKFAVEYEFKYGTTWWLVWFFVCDVKLEHRV